MIQKFQQLQALHNAFFESDDNNIKTMVAGFIMSATAILLVVGFYQL